MTILMLMSVWVAFAFAVGMYIHFVVRTMFIIILPGLQKLFLLFVVHLVVFFFSLMLSLSRPAWTNDMGSMYWENAALCHFYGRTATILGMASLVIPTLFGYLKIFTYVEIVGKEGALQKQVLVLRYTIVLWIFVCFLNVFFTDSSRQVIEGVQLCFQYPPLFCVGATTVLWLGINGFILYVCFQYRDLRNSSIPHLEHQMHLNLYVIPFIFFTTFIARLVGVCNDSDNMTLVLFLRMMPKMLDDFLNSWVMYWFLFGTKSEIMQRPPASSRNIAAIEMTIKERQKERRKMCQSVVMKNVMVKHQKSVHSHEDSISRSRSPEGVEQWVSLPGIHPLRLVVKNETFEDMLIPPQLLEKQRWYFENPWTCRAGPFVCDIEEEEVQPAAAELPPEEQVPADFQVYMTDEELKMLELSTTRGSTPEAASHKVLME